MSIGKILVVGTGSIGTRHLTIARSIFPKSEIAVYKRKASLAFVSGEADIIFSDVNDVIEYKPSLAIIANPAPFHIGIATQLAKNGAHLLIEKPISDSTDMVLNLIELCCEKKLKLTVGYNLRFLPSLNEFKKFVELELVGKIHTIESNYGRNLSTWRSNVDYKNSVTANKDLGGGVLFELSHEIDYLRWIFGEISWIEADIRKISNLKINVEDYANIQFGLSGKHKEAHVNLNLDCFRHDTRRTCTVVGEKATLRWDAELNLVQLWKKSTTGWVTLYKTIVERNFTYEQQLKHFVNSITNDTDPRVSGLDGLRALEIVLAAKSINQKQKNRMFI